MGTNQSSDTTEQLSKRSNVIVGCAWVGQAHCLFIAGGLTPWVWMPTTPPPPPLTVGRRPLGGGAFGMSPWCVVLDCSWRRLVADSHSLPFP